MGSVWSRAFDYFRRHGVRRSALLMRKKLSGRVPWNIRSPATSSVRYLGDHGAALGDSSPPAPGPQLFGVPSIAIIGDLNLPQCKKFRVMQKMEALHELGFRASHSFWRDVPRCVDLLQTASHVIFYRMTDSDLLRAYLGEARRLGLAASYDIDDPIFDEAIYGGNRNLDLITAGERRHLVAQCGSYLAAMRACDTMIVSTPGLARLAEQRAGKPSFVWRNAVDAETLHAAKLALRTGTRRRDTDDLVIGYASGSRAHAADFTEAEEAITGLLQSNSQARLVIAGYHEMSPKLAAFGSRISVVPFTDYQSYIATVAGFDINLVPLLQDGFNDCKSAIRFLDAAVVGVPTIASRTGDFVNVIVDGENGLIADGAANWLPQLKRLAGDAGLRRRMAEAAKRLALTKMTAVSAAKAVDRQLWAQFGDVEAAA